MWADEHAAEQDLAKSSRLVKQSPQNSERFQLLQVLRSSPLETVELWAKEKILEAYEHWQGKVYLSYSGGADSRVLLELCLEVLPSGFPVVFCDTGVEYPEVRAAALRSASVVLKPRLSFHQTCQRYGYPIVSKRTAQYLSEIQTPTVKNVRVRHLRMTGFKLESSEEFQLFSGSIPGPVKSYYSMVAKRWQFLRHAPFKISAKCCDVMKKEPFKRYAAESGCFPIIGTLADEAAQRELTWLETGCNSFEQASPVSRPLSVWTKQHILQFLLDRKIKVPSVYGEIVGGPGELRFSGVQRTGCMPCGFGMHLEEKEGPNRYEQMRLTHPKQYKAFLDKMGMRQVLTWYGVRFESPRAENVKPVQLGMFGGVA
jgi:3'-phosphoadenosine 5'-phosphosulfate sulfotransferase (PAPS reductase)/FAD synthetase